MSPSTRASSARASTAQLAALGPAASIADSAPFLLLFLSIAATNLVARAHAAADARRRGAARASVALGALGGGATAARPCLGRAGALSRASTAASRAARDSRAPSMWR